LIPQSFVDERGLIENIADGSLGDVAVITSKANAVRANHVHQNDWHISYLISGAMEYYWIDEYKEKIVKSITVVGGEMVYTPQKVPHKMVFSEDSVLIAISGLSRVQENYEFDTKRLPNDFFN
jgi:uncharacterized RmlC-like cupin family protein